ncbi:hypothetical protein [Micromonospora sp. DT47]
MPLTRAGAARIGFCAAALTIVAMVIDTVRITHLHRLHRRG